MEDEAQIAAPAGWNVNTLREYFLRIIADQEKAVRAALESSDKATSAALAAADKATEKAEQADGKRFDSVNEFRQTLSDQTATFMPRSEVSVLISALNDKADRAQTALRTLVITTIGLALTTGVSVTIAILR